MPSINQRVQPSEIASTETQGVQLPQRARKAVPRSAQRDRAGAELKCCAPLDPLPMLAAGPASLRRN